MERTGARREMKEKYKDIKSLLGGEGDFLFPSPNVNKIKRIGDKKCT